MHNILVILVKVSNFGGLTIVNKGMKGIFRDIRMLVVTLVTIMWSVNVAQAQGMDYTYFAQDDAPKVRMEWGFGAGASYTGVQHISTEAIKLNPRMGLGAHFDMAVCFGRNFAIETEIRYEGASIKAATSMTSHKVKTTTIDIPLLLSVRLANSRVRINAGPLFTVMSRAEYTEGGELMFFGPAYPTWNVAAGVGVGITRHCIIEARYIYGLKDSINQFGGVEFSTRTYRITAGVTMLF